MYPNSVKSNCHKNPLNKIVNKNYKAHCNVRGLRAGRWGMILHDLYPKSDLSSHVTQLMTLAARDSSISPALPQRLLVPVLQMLHGGAGATLLSEPVLTLSDEFSCHFNYAAFHSVTHSVSQWSVYSPRNVLTEQHVGTPSVMLFSYVGLLMNERPILLV